MVMMMVVVVVAVVVVSAAGTVLQARRLDVLLHGGKVRLCGGEIAGF
jgi:hypothetical protein